MKKTFIFLCSYFVFTCAASYNVSAFDSIERATDSPAEKYYKSILRQQAAEREVDEEAARQKKKYYDDLYAKQAAERRAAEEDSRQLRLKEEEIKNKAEAEQEAQYEAEEEALQKQCGNDYKNLRVGMKLDRVQKCVAEFFLRGQMKTKKGVVDHYSRGGTYLYVKNGRVVAWGE